MLDYSAFKNMAYEKRTRCCICRQPHIEPVINLPDFPVTEVYVDNKIEDNVGVLDQFVHLCPNCSHTQLENIISSDLLYGDTDNYAFRTSQSMSGQKTSEFFKNFFLKNKRKEVYDSIVDVGCNDLYLLHLLSEYGKALTGIDPILRNAEVVKNSDNITVVGDFYENTALDENPDMILCKDMLEHVEDPRAVLETMVSKSTADADFFVQVPIMDTIVEESRFDLVFHQHRNYFSIASFNYLINELGCSLVNYTVNYDHWGAAIFYFTKSHKKVDMNIPRLSRQMVLDSYALFCNAMKTTQKHILFLSNHKIYGYGAALMLPVIFYYLGIDAGDIDCILDDDETKIGRTYLNLPVDIRATSGISDIGESVILITALSSKINTRRIMDRLFKMKPRYIITPLHSV
jgi:hypothetical protein